MSTLRVGHAVVLGLAAIIVEASNDNFGERILILGADETPSCLMPRRNSLNLVWNQNESEECDHGADVSRHARRDRGAFSSAPTP